MTDHQDDIEALLRNYRPIGPPADLKHRIVHRGSRSVWPWAVAAALLLVSIVGVQAASSRTIERLRAADRDAVPAIEDLAASLGGDDAAHLLAATVVANLRADAALLRGGTDAPQAREGVGK